MNISDVMTRDVKFCSPDMRLDQVAMMMWDGDYGVIPVVDNENRPIGMVTDRDIVMCCALNQKSLKELTISTIIGNRELFSCSANDELESALSIMKERKVRRLPVTNDQGYLAGILSIGDIVAFTEEAKSATAIPYEVTMNTLKAVAIHH